MSIARMINTLGRFLQEHGIKEKGVRVVIEFDDPENARKFVYAVYDEFRPLTYEHFEPPKQIKEQRIYGIPLKVKAEITTP